MAGNCLQEVTSPILAFRKQVGLRGRTQGLQPTLQSSIVEGLRELLLASSTSRVDGELRGVGQAAVDGLQGARSHRTAVGEV